MEGVRSADGGDVVRFRENTTYAAHAVSWPESARRWPEFQEEVEARILQIREGIDNRICLINIQFPQVSGLSHRTEMLIIHVINGEETVRFHFRLETAGRYAGHIATRGLDKGHADGHTNYTCSASSIIPPGGGGGGGGGGSGGGGTERPAVSEVQAEALEMQKYREEMSKETLALVGRVSAHECSVCFQPLTAPCPEYPPPDAQLSLEERRVVVTLGCHHMFHRGCMEGWRRKGKDECPLCRVKFKFPYLYSGTRVADVSMRLSF